MQHVVLRSQPLRAFEGDAATRADGRPNRVAVDELALEDCEGEGILEKAKGRELKGADEVYARETVQMAKYPDTVKVQLQVMVVGETAVVAIPCEVFTEIGLAIKKAGPFKTTCVVSLANGYFGYLPTPAQHALGGYETWRARSSFLEVGASVKIEKTIGELMKDASAR